MDNDTYDDRHSRQQKFNKNIVKRIEELEDFAQTAAVEANARFDIGIENRTKAFERIEELEEQFRLLEQYTVKGLTESLRELRYDMDIKLETIDDILVVHRNQNDTQRKNHASLIKVWDEKVIPLIEGTHGKKE